MKYKTYEALPGTTKESELRVKKLSTSILTVFFVALALSGCAQNLYHVQDLPAQFAAEPVPNLDALNLSSFATQGTGHDTIAWGDELTVNIHSGYESDPPDPVVVRVARDGSVAIPAVGRVFLAGMEIEQAENLIAAESRRRQVYPNPFVAVQFKTRRATQVTVVGAVEKPGTYSLQRGESSLMAAIVAAGGLSKDANENIQIKRAALQGTSSNIQQASMTVDPATGQVIPSTIPTEDGTENGIIQINLLEPNGGEVPGRYALNEGDVVTVPRRELPAIHVLGLVRTPGAVELNGDQDIHLLDAIAAAGGVSSKPADRVLVIRRGKNPDDEPARIAASIQKAIDGNDNLRLAPGDTVIVRSTPATVFDDVFRTFVRMSVGSSVTLW